MQLILDLSAAKPCVPHKVLVAHPELANERANVQVCHTASPCQESVRAPSYSGWKPSDKLLPL